MSLHWWIRVSSTILQPNTPDINPLPAASCLLDPSLAAVLMEPDQATLLHAAKRFISSDCQNSRQHLGSLGPFPVLASKIRMQEQTAAASTHSADTEVSQLQHCFTDTAQVGNVSGLNSGTQRPASYTALAACSGLAGLCRTSSRCADGWPLDDAIAWATRSRCTHFLSLTNACTICRTYYVLNRHCFCCVTSPWTRTLWFCWWWGYDEKLHVALHTVLTLTCSTAMLIWHKQYYYSLRKCFNTAWRTY